MADNGGPTVDDVARAAGVAPSTVSRTFARSARVGAATAERVRAAAADLGFRPRSPGRARPARGAAVFALVLPDLTDPAGAEILRGAQAAAAAGGYSTLVSDVAEPGTRARAALDRALAGADGVVVAGSALSDEVIRATAAHRPVVVLDRVLAGVPGVVTDNARGMRQTVAHLAALGHEHVTYLAGPPESWTDAVRRRSLRQSGTEQGVQSRRVGPFPPTVAGGAAAADEVLAWPTTAVIAFNDLMAMGLIRALAARGLRVPDDLSVVGFDGIFAAELNAPALTTVAAPLRLMGDTAVRHLLAVRAGARPSIGDPLVLPAGLMVRASTARRRRIGRLISSTWTPAVLAAMQQISPG